MIHHSHIITVPFTNKRVWFGEPGQKFTPELNKWFEQRKLYISPESFLMVTGPQIIQANGLGSGHPYDRLIFFMFQDAEVAVEFQLRFC